MKTVVRRIISWILSLWLIFPAKISSAQVVENNDYQAPTRAEFTKLPDAREAGKFVSDKMHQTLSEDLNRVIKEVAEPLGRDIAPGGDISRRKIGNYDSIAIPNKLVQGDGMLSPAEALYVQMEESFFGDLNPTSWVPCNGFREIKTADYVAAAKFNCPQGLVDPFNPTCECTITSPICFPQGEAKPIEWWAPTYVATVNRDGARRDNPYIMPGPHNVGLSWSSIKAEHEALQQQFIAQLERKIPGFQGDDYKTPKVASKDFEFGQETGGLNPADPAQRSVRLRRLLWEWNAANNRSPMVHWGYKMNELMKQPPCANNLLMRPDEPYYANTSEKGLRSLIAAFPDFAMLERPLLKAGDYRLVVNSNNFQDIFQAADDNSWLTRLVPSYLAQRNRDDAPNVYREGLKTLEVVPYSTDRMKEIILPRSGVSLRADNAEYSFLPPLSQDAVLALKAFLYDSNPTTPGTAGKRIRRFSIHQAKESTSSFHGPQQRPEKRIFTDMMQIVSFKKGQKRPSECFGAENIPGYEVLQGPEKEAWSFERILYDQDGFGALHGETAFVHRNLQREVSCEWCGRIAGCLLLHDGDVEKNSFEGSIPRSDIPEEFEIAYKYWRGEATRPPRPKQAALIAQTNLSQTNQGKPSYVPGYINGLSAPPSIPGSFAQAPQAPLLNCILGDKDRDGGGGAGASGGCPGGVCTGSKTLSLRVHSMIPSDSGVNALIARQTNSSRHSADLICLRPLGSKRYQCQSKAAQINRFQKNPLDEVALGGGQLLCTDETGKPLAPESDNVGDSSGNIFGGLANDGTGVAAGGGLAGALGGGLLPGLLGGLLGSLLNGGGNQNNNQDNKPETDTFRCECKEGYIHCYQNEEALPLRDPVPCVEDSKQEQANPKPKAPIGAKFAPVRSTMKSDYRF